MPQSSHNIQMHVTVAIYFFTIGCYYFLELGLFSWKYKYKLHIMYILYMNTTKDFDYKGIRLLCAQHLLASHDIFFEHIITHIGIMYRFEMCFALFWLSLYFFKNYLSEVNIHGQFWRQQIEVILIWISLMHERG